MVSLTLEGTVCAFYTLCCPHLYLLPIVKIFDHAYLLQTICRLFLFDLLLPSIFSPHLSKFNPIVSAIKKKIARVTTAERIQCITTCKVSHVEYDSRAFPDKHPDYRIKDLMPFF